MNAILEKLNTRYKNYVALAAFAALILLFYGSTVFNDFAHDDFGIIVNNEYTHSLRYLPKVITGCILESALGDCATQNTPYRPVQSLSYLLTYQISPNPWIFHLVNLLYFLGAAFLVFLFVKLLCKNYLVAFLSSVLFIAHPINNEAVNWIAAVPELSATVLVLLAALFYVRYRKGLGDKNFFLCALFYFFGMLAKEPVVFFPIIALALDLLVFRMVPQALVRAKELQRYGVFAGLLAVFVTLRAVVLHGLINPQPFFHFTAAERVYAFFSLFAQYIVKVVYPYPLLFFYPFEKKSDFFSFEFIGAALVFLFFFATLAFLVWKRKNLFTFFFIWFFLFLVTVLVFVDSVGENVFSERYLFIPSIGFAFLVASFLVYLFRYKKKEVRIGAGVFLFVLIASSWFFVQDQNKIWKNNETLFLETLKQNPDAHALRYDYAVGLGAKGDILAAKKEFEEIENRKPDWVYIDKVYSNLGDVYGFAGDKEQAIGYYEKAIAANSLYLPAYNRIGGLYAQDEEYLKALPYFCKASSVNPDFMQAGQNFERVGGLVLEEQKKNPGAFSEQLVKGGAFAKSDTEKVRFLGKQCEKEACSFFFASRFDSGEVVLPLLIEARGDSSLIFEFVNKGMNPNDGTIRMTVTQKEAESIKKFVFPTCDGVYYEAII